MEIAFIGYNHIHDSDLNIVRPLGSGDFLVLLVKSPAIFNVNGKDIFTPPNIFFYIQRIPLSTTKPVAQLLSMIGCISILHLPTKKI